MLSICREAYSFSEKLEIELARLNAWAAEFGCARRRILFNNALGIVFHGSGIIELRIEAAFDG